MKTTRKTFAQSRRASRSTPGLSTFRPARRQASQRQIEHASDDQVHGWSRQRHDEFLGRLLGNPLEARHATDRQQDHVRRLHAIAPGGEDMAKLVQQHAQEQKRDEQNARYRGVPAALHVVRAGNPQEEQQEGNVQANHRAFTVPMVIDQDMVPPH